MSSFYFPHDTVAGGGVGGIGGGGGGGGGWGREEGNLKLRKWAVRLTANCFPDWDLNSDLMT